MEEVLGIYPQACRFFLRLPYHHISIYLMRKASYREKEHAVHKNIEPNALIITIFLAERRIVNNYMCGIG
jgi:hypothetical protein